MLVQCECGHIFDVEEEKEWKKVGSERRGSHGTIAVACPECGCSFHALWKVKHAPPLFDHQKGV